MKAWFLRFTLREQLMLLAMAVAIVTYIVVALVLVPMEQQRRERSARNVATAEALGRVDAMVTELEALRGSGNRSARGGNRNLTALLNRSVAGYGLQISRLQPNSQGAVQVRFESVPLEPLLRWIHRLETADGLLVQELSMSQVSAAGYVSVSLRVSGAAG